MFSRRFFLIFVGLSLVVQISYSKPFKPQRRLKEYRRAYARINQVELPISNSGEMGYEGNNSWPRGMGEYYIFDMGIWLGTMKEGTPNVSCGYDFYYGPNLKEMCPGPPEHVPDYDAQGAGAHPEDSLYFSGDIGSEEEWKSITGNPFIAQPASGGEDIWCDFNDMWLARHTAGRQPNGKPIGLYIKQTVFGWRTPIYENMLFVLYQIKNATDEKIKDLYVAYGCDMDVGDEEGAAANDLLGCDIGRSFGWTYQTTQEAGWTSPPPYYVGVRFFEGPRADDTVFVACHPDSEGYPWAHSDTVLPGEPLVLTSFNKCIRGDASDELRQWRLISGHHFETGEYNPWRGVHDTIPGDKRMLLGAGPFDMDPGEVDTFLVAFCFSNGNTGGLDYLLAEADAAYDLYKRNWVVAGPPPSPKLTAIPGDRKVTLIWDNSPEFVRDPYIDVLRDTTLVPPADTDTVYREYDFEGYVLYRSRTGRADDWEELGQWDIKNDIYLLPGDVWYCGPNDTGSASGKKSKNEGLVYSYVDTDSVFNGITYYYAVIAYDFNTRGYYQNESDIWVSLPSGKKAVVVQPRAEPNNFVAPKVDSLTRTKGATNTVVLSADILGNLEVTGHQYEVHWGEIREKDSMPVYTFNIRDVDKNAYISEKYLESSPVRDSVVVVSKRDSTITFVRVDSTADSIIEERTIIWDTIRVDSTWIWTSEISKPFDGLMLDGKINVPIQLDSLLTKKKRIDTLVIKPGAWQNWEDTTIVDSFIQIDTLRDTVYTYFGLPDTIFVEYDAGAHTYHKQGLQPRDFHSGGVMGKKWAHHGKTDIEIRWEKYHGSPDSLTMHVFDMSNDGVEIPYDSGFGDNWCFMKYLLPLGPYLTPDQSSACRRLFYVAGVMYWFNAGGVFSWDSCPDPGDIWKVKSVPGSVAPVRGNIFSFGTEKFSYGDTLKMDLIKVVPNPYLVRARWDRSKDIRKIEFTHLPSRCTIRIYTLDGVLIRKLEHDATKNPAIGGAEAWDLLTMNEQHIAGGIYIYHASTPQGQEKVGKFAVIR